MNAQGHKGSVVAVERGDLFLVAAARAGLSGRAHVPWEVYSLLRFLLAFVVVCYHIHIFFPMHSRWVEGVASLGGKAAVVGFLYLSGFSIAGSLFRNPSGFFRRRIYRIYPSYFVAIVFTIALSVWASKGILVEGRSNMPSSVPVLFAHFLFLQTFVVSAATYNVALWSLAIEVAYYGMARLLLSAAGFWVARVFALLSAISFVIPEISDLGAVLWIFTKLKFIKYYWCWHAGVEAYKARTDVRCWVLCAMMCMLVSISHETPERLSAVLVFLVGVSALVRSRLDITKPLKTVFDILGDVSYPLYLLHLPLFYYLWAMGYRGISVFLLAALLAALGMVLVVERRLKPRYFSWILKG